MDIQGVPKIGISSVVHSKHIDPNSIDVVDNEALLPFIMVPVNWKW